MSWKLVTDKAYLLLSLGQDNPQSLGKSWEWGKLEYTESTWKRKEKRNSERPTVTILNNVTSRHRATSVLEMVDNPRGCGQTWWPTQYDIAVTTLDWNVSDVTVVDSNIDHCTWSHLLTLGLSRCPRPVEQTGHFAAAEIMPVSLRHQPVSLSFGDGL